MATIAIVPSDVTSKRMLARRLGRSLRDAGHRVVFVVATDEPDDPGFERRPVALHPPSDGVRRRWRPIAQWRSNGAAASAIDPSRLGGVLDEVAADLVIIDIEEYEALISALALHDRPVAVLCSFFEVWPIAGLGPNDAGPAGGPLDRARGCAAWWVMWARLRLHGVKHHVVGEGTDRIAVSRVLARRLGVRRQLTSRQWLHPFAPKHLPMLVCNALEFDVPHEPRDGVFHIGPLLTKDALVDESDPDLDAVVAAARSAGRPIVLCVFGAVMAGARSPLLDRIGEVARLRPGYQFVVGTANAEHRAALDDLPNVHCAEWIPQRRVLSVADAAIVHSGNATLHECLAARVPMVVYPFTVNDQARNAARVVRHGVGEVGDGAREDAPTIAARLDRVLADDDMRRRIGDLAGPITRYGRDGLAVAAVEEVLRTWGSHVNDASHTPP